MFCKNIKNKFATTNNNFEKNQLFRHASSYHVHVGHINFQQTRVSRSVQTVHTNLFAKRRKLYKFATTNSNVEKKTILLDMLHHKTDMYINFQQNRVNRSVITVHKMYLQKNCKLHKFAITNSNCF